MHNIGRNAGRTVCLTLPASYEEVDKALAEFGDARPEAPVLIQEARTSVPYLEGRLKGLSFEERENRQELSFLARRIRYLTQTEQDVFSAALRMEEPGTLEEIINLSYNLDQYERIPHGQADSPSGPPAPQRTYKSQIHPGSPPQNVPLPAQSAPWEPESTGIEQFVDMDRMAKALMEETGAVETSHGIVTSDKWRFRDLSGDLVTTRLFSPVQGEFFEEDDWGNMGDVKEHILRQDLKGVFRLPEPDIQDPAL